MIKKISKIQPDAFEFSDENLKLYKEEIKKYPKERKSSAVLALLYLAQKQNENWIPLAAIKYVAKLLEIPYIQVYEVATFYSMFNLEPIGKNFVQICRTTPCWLRGSEKLSKVAQEVCQIKLGETSSDNSFTLVEVECLGACCNAPMVQINDDYYEDLDEDSFREILVNLKKNKNMKPGSQIGRQSSHPERKTNA